MDLPGVPSSVLEALQGAARSLGIPRLALVGGAVRDQLLHQRCGRPWLGAPDLDWVVEGDAAALVAELVRQIGGERITGVQEHGAFGTVALQLDGIPLDLATAREEHYPAPAENPVVRAGSLHADLARRDFTINAMAFDLVAGELIDLHHGQEDLASGQLRFLHAGSVEDDPTRVIRAARYAARLGFQLADESLAQIHSTMAQWPWGWGQRDAALTAPPALATRLRMELERLLDREPWPQALDLLEQWQALPLLDPQLQSDPRRTQRLRWAQRLGLPLMPALLLGAVHPVALAQRLQIPGKQQQWLQQCGALGDWLEETPLPLQASPSVWSAAIEHQGWPPEAVALAVTLKPKHWKPLLRWWGRWRRIQAPQTARDLIAAGWQPGLAIGDELRRQRSAAQDRSR
ncbi:tRNA nucleotidyltransferase [Synechococcus sp. KORDI-52]|uniref:CCA tRNA nucleotidyltransferase n=1 Tax=Synechococcus sp. KORDI-52 TaxID=585425 RepID=UPI0004E09979|nr:CCA tRNA nucleotidyltransferase [Synechococcus sp. KORDI-52]AII47856.1 tRNA nucleotidyltransferase [Synechococcus sp. KORDI-52]